MDPSIRVRRLVFRLAGALSLVSASLVAGVLAAPADSGAQGPPPDLARCTEDLLPGNPMAVQEAAECLRKLGPAAAPAIPKLIPLLGESQRMFWDGLAPDGRMTGGSTSPRDGAVAVLRAIGDAAVLPMVEALTKDRDPRVREGVALAMSAMPDPRFVAPLVRALGDGAVVPGSSPSGQARVCDQVAKTLVGLSAPATADALLAAASQAASPQRERAAAVLVARGDVHVLPLLDQWRQSPVGSVRAEGVRLLGQTNAPLVVDALIDALGDADATVKLAAVDALGRRDYGGAPGTSPPDERRALAALQSIEARARADYQRRSALDAATKESMTLAERAFDAQRAIQERRARRDPSSAVERREREATIRAPL